MLRKALFLALCVGCYSHLSAQLAQPSVLASGDWFKMKIENRGVYKLTYQYLSNAGVEVNNIDPRTIKIYGNPGGMLPQPIAENRPFDLLENTILVVGEDDGSFDNGDYILFYAQDGDHYFYDEEGQLRYEHNIYDDANFYFLTTGGEQGKRLQTTADEGTNFPVINSFDSFQYYEKEKINLLTSGREWYSERFDLTNSQTYTFSFPKILNNAVVKTTVNVMAQSFADADFDVLINEANAGKIAVESVPDFTQRVFRYSIKGKESTGQFITNTATQNVEVRLQFNKSGSGLSVGFLNNILVETKELLTGEFDFSIFRSLSSLNNSTTTFSIANATQNTKIWDITDPSNVKNQPFNFIDNSAKFGANTTTLREFVVINPARVDNQPANINRINNQGIKALTSSQMIIIATPQFYDEAKRLAEFKLSYENLTTDVVLIESVYNEFSSGRQDVTAIRDFVKYLYDNGNLQYLLLFGRGSYDYKDVIANNTNFVPIYESRNSLHPLDTYASDDYYGFLENDEGEWAEIVGGNHTLDIGVGRLPVVDQKTAKSVVDKIINYYSNPKTLGDWRNKNLFVADDGDFNLHQRQADELTQFVDTTYSAFNTEKFFLDAFPQEARANGEKAPLANKALDEEIEQGALIVNFTGHGGEVGWMQEQVLDLVQIERWTNYNQLPLFVTATCEFSRHDDPRRISGGEMVVTSDKGGGIAIVSTCRPVSSSSNFVLNKAFYENIYKKENGEYLRLGDVFRLTKNASFNLATDLNKVGNRNFSLLGDPSLRLAYPEKEVVLTAINNNLTLSDTLKAQAEVVMAGEIKNANGTRDESFDGEVSVVIFDKPISKVTLGNENAPYTHQVLENVIFRGSATVTNGLFDFNFIMPRNISYQVGNGKVNLYATKKNSLTDANGSNINVKIGGSATPNTADTRGPEIKLFIGDSLNTNLNGVSHNTQLFVNLKDQSGINISKFGTDNNITTTLDNSQTFILNDYYKANKDQFEEGWAIFPLQDLSKGRHTLSVKAWDNFNNSATAEIEFVVADPNTIVIYDLINYPNPVRESTTFRFSHNRAGENLELTIDILSAISGTVFTSSVYMENVQSEQDIFEWNGQSNYNEKLDPGIYIYRLTVRSVRDGAKKQEYKKLILIN